jgi:endonuclease/exonuclease/phosphatase family metal-dependent hydrolase
MRLMTYNIHGWRTTDGAPNLDALTRVIADAGADIIGLNEVFHPHAVEGANGPALKALAERLGMHFVFGPCMRWPATDEMPADAYGNALLSRFPIIASASHHLTPKDPHLQQALAGKEQRGLLEARILTPGGGTFTVYVTHLDYSEEEARLVQVRLLQSWTSRDRNRPHVVMGDFNALSAWDLNGRQTSDLTHHKGSDLGGEDGPRVIARMEKAGYQDVYALFGEPGQQSYIPSADPPIRIDYIFASQPLTPHLRACEIWREPPGQEASDHRPLIVEIEY